MDLVTAGNSEQTVPKVVFALSVQHKGAEVDQCVSMSTSKHYEVFKMRKYNLYNKSTLNQ